MSWSQPFLETPILSASAAALAAPAKSTEPPSSPMRPVNMEKSWWDIMGIYEIIFRQHWAFHDSTTTTRRTRRRRRGEIQPAETWFLIHLDVGMLGVSDNTILRFCGCEWNDKLHPFIAEDDLMLFFKIFKIFKGIATKKKKKTTHFRMDRSSEMEWSLTVLSWLPLVASPIQRGRNVLSSSHVTHLLWIQFSGNKTRIKTHLVGG